MICRMFSTELLTHLPLEKNGIHFATDIFRWILVNEKLYVSIRNSLEFIPKGPIGNNSALEQIMAWRHPGNKPLSEPMLTRFTEAYMWH